MNESYDVVVIGGGAAGLSSAVALARSRRSILVADAGEPRNSQADHVHNFLTRDGTLPADLYAAGRAEVLRHTSGPFAAEQDGQFTALGLPVIDGIVVRVEARDGRLTGVLLADGTLVALDALVIAPRFTANADLLEPSGLTPVEVSVGGQVIGTRIEADASGATSVPGIYAAGNVTDPQAQVITSAAAGLTAGAAINMDLIAEDAMQAITIVRMKESA